MRPLVHPSLVTIWRDPTTVQIGLDPHRAIVLGGVGPVEASVLRSIDGVNDQPALHDSARRAGGDPSSVDRLVEILGAAGVLVDGDSVNPADPADAFTPDHASLGLVTGAPDGGASIVRVRNLAHVEVRGAGRIGAVVARLLAAAGIGTVTVDDGERVQPADLAPGGLESRHIGRTRANAVEDLLPSDADDRVSAGPDVVVLSPVTGTGRGDALTLLRRGVTHLITRVVEVTGIVGPLVLPGRSSCLCCHDLHRSDRDRAWPRVLAQADGPPAGVTACDVTLATQVAALAAQQVLAHIDGFVPASVDGTIETRLPYGLPLRRSWRPHPACGCMWPG